MCDNNFIIRIQKGTSRFRWHNLAHDYAKICGPCDKPKGVFLNYGDEYRIENVLVQVGSFLAGLLKNARSEDLERRRRNDAKGLY